MAPQECHPAQGWADASVRAGPPARPARGWHLRTPGDGAPPSRAPEKGQRAPPGAWDAGVGGAQPRPTMARGIAPGEPPSSNRRWPPAKGAAPMVAKVVRTPGRGGADSWAHGPRGRRPPAGRLPRWSPPGKTHARGNLGDGLRPSRLRGVEKPGSLHNFKPLPGAPDVDGVASAPG